MARACVARASKLEARLGRSLAPPLVRCAYNATQFRDILHHSLPRELPGFG